MLRPRGRRAPHRSCAELNTMMAFTTMQLLWAGPAAIVAAAVLGALAGIRRVPNNRVGVVEKRWTTRGSVASGFIALQGRAEYQRSLQEAARIKAMAEAEASKIRMPAEADAERAARVAIGQAMAVEEQVRAYGGPVYQLTQQVLGRFADAIQHSGADVVPKSVMGGAGTGGGQGSIMEAMLTMLLSDRMLQITPQASAAAGPEVAAIKGQILHSISRTAPKNDVVGSN